MRENAIQISNGSIAPCKGCATRHEGCHGKCPAYGAWDKERQKQKEAQRQQRHDAYDLDDVARIRRDRHLELYRKTGKKMI